MNAMDNASKNAKDIYAKLELNYNKARQAKVTTELCEIISGANSVWRNFKVDYIIDYFIKLILWKPYT